MSTPATGHGPVGDHQVTDTARRVGPPLVAGSLLLTIAVLTWLAVAPTAIAGPLSEAPFTVPASLVLPPDDAGCLRVVDGAGASVEHCIDELAAPAEDDEGHRSTEAWFDDEGQVVVTVFEDHDMADMQEDTLVIDPATGDVVDRGDVRGREPPPFDEEEAYPDGDRVLRSHDGRWDPEEDEVLLDLEGPPGYRIEQAMLSSDEQWVVVTTWRDEVVVAPADGSADPRVWTHLPDDRWLELHRAIDWQQ